MPPTNPNRRPPFSLGPPSKDVGGDTDREMPLVPLPPPFAQPSILRRADGLPAHLEGSLLGSSMFLVLSGPSAKTVDLSLLQGRGIVSMAVNNSWALFRPTHWTSLDPPDRFIDQGWKDPGILKMVPRGYTKHRLRTFDPSVGKIRRSRFSVHEMPSTFFYGRRHTFDHRTFLDDSAIQWGNLKGQKDSLGNPACRSVMLAALRLCFHLGATTVYLVGCDFHMPPEGDAYAFPQEKTPGGRKSNNHAYAILGRRLAALAPLLKERGLRVFNCNKESALKCFPHRPFEEAVRLASRGSSKPIVTEGWYEGTTKAPKESPARIPHTPKEGTLEERRAHELSKYEALILSNPGYGATRYGKPVVDIIAPLVGAGLADLGCGKNLFAKRLRSKGVKALGVDWAFPDADIKAPMWATGLASGAFDWVTTFDSLEHLLEEDVPLVIAEMKRLLSPGGRCCHHIASDHSKDAVNGEGLHPTVRPREWWLDRFREAGFRVDEPPTPELAEYIWLIW